MTPAFETSWNDQHSWWLEELASDPAYETEIAPMVLGLARPKGLVLDVGCGDGRLMALMSALDCVAMGVDVSRELLRHAQRHGGVVQLELPSLEPFTDDAFDVAIISLVLEHLPDHVTMLEELARVVRTGGALALVVNHPIYTAPASAPIEEPDGEVLWRPGRYFDEGYTDEPAGMGTVRFHHRPLATLLTDASNLGWDLEEMVESGVTDSQVERHPPMARQRHIPRLLGVRWRRR